ncbi:AAA family ATPase [Deinococcus ruber]|nr:AAA family ATPase [Deinococcus ruber]
MTFQPQKLYGAAPKAFTLFPALRERETIPAALKARHAGPAMRVISSPTLQAMAMLLTGEVELRQAFTLEEGTYQQVLYAGRANGTSWSCLQMHDTLTLTSQTETLPLILLALTASASLPIFEEINVAWKLFLSKAANLNLTLPCTQTQLQQNAAALKDVMIRLCDVLTYTLESHPITIESANPLLRGDVVTPLVLSGMDLPAPPALPLSTPDTGIVGDLTHWLKRGLNVLMTGPTSTFKTTAANRALLNNHAAIFTVAGRPGLEDRDFYGGIYPGASGPEWIPGPVTQAFSSAANGTLTGIVFNEVTRFEALYFNATIGMMDEYSGAELAAQGITLTPQALQDIGLTSQSDGRFYLLTLPNGTQIPCRKELLCFIGTANLGSDYVTTGELDAALLRRFDRHVEMPHPERHEVMPMLIRAAGDAYLADVGYTLEVFTRTQVLDQSGRSDKTSAEGLLLRPMNFSVTRALLDETRELCGRGMPAQVAFLKAAQSTVVPYCVPRQPNGQLDPAALERLTDDIRRYSLGLGQ